MPAKCGTSSCLECGPGEYLNASAAYVSVPFAVALNAADEGGARASTNIADALAGEPWAVASSVCADLDEDWVDNEEDSCHTYAQMEWCAEGGYGPGWQHGETFADYADEDGVDAGMACCACRPKAGHGISSVFAFPGHQPLSDSRSTLLKEHVLLGGNLILAGPGSASAASDMFGWSLDDDEWHPYPCASTRRVSEAHGFSQGPSSLPSLGGAMGCVSVSSLFEIGAVPVFAADGGASVWVAAAGRGHVIGLAPDLDHDDTSPEWDEVIRRSARVGRVASPCQQCPGSSSSARGSTDVSDCTCNAGFTGPECGKCSAGTYKDQAGSAEC